MTLWRRIARLARQSRIRLPSRPVRASELSPGDWVQLGAERWRVTARRFESDRVVFRLRPLRGTARAVLVAPADSTGSWSWYHSGGTEVSVPPELLVAFQSSPPGC